MVIFYFRACYKSVKLYVEAAVQRENSLVSIIETLRFPRKEITISDCSLCCKKGSCLLSFHKKMRNHPLTYAQILDQVPKNIILDIENGLICSSCQENVVKLYVRDKNMSKQADKFRKFLSQFGVSNTSYAEPDHLIRFDSSIEESDSTSSMSSSFAETTDVVSKSPRGKKTKAKGPTQVTPKTKHSKDEKTPEDPFLIELEEEIERFSVVNCIDTGTELDDPMELVNFDFGIAESKLKADCPKLTSVLKALSGKKELGKPEVSAACILAFSRSQKVNLLQKEIAIALWKGGLNRQVFQYTKNVKVACIKF